MVARRLNVALSVFRVVLCTTLIIAILGLNLGHVAEASAGHTHAAAMHVAAMLDGGEPGHGGDSEPAGTPPDCGDYGCHFVPPMQLSAVVDEECFAIRLPTPAVGCGAGLLLPEKPPRQ